MEIIVKKDILDHLQAKSGYSKEDAQNFLANIIEEIAKNIRLGHRVYLEQFGYIEILDQTNEKGKKDKQQIAIKNLVNNVSQSTGLEFYRVLNTANILFHFIREMVIKNYEVQIIDFASFRLKDIVIGKDNEKKQDIIPNQKKFICEFEKKFFIKVNAEKLAFIIDKNFAKEIKGVNLSSILLIVPEKDFFIKTIEYYFQKAGWKINTALNLEEIEYSLNNTKIYLVILDDQVEDACKICERIKCDPKTNSIPLVRLLTSPENLPKTGEFKICGDRELIQPFELKKLLELSKDVLKEANEEDALSQELQMRFTTTEANIEKSTAICNKLFAGTGLSEKDKISFNAALKEAIGNGAQHGNKYRKDKLLEVYYAFDDNQITVTITDSGPGFDWRQFFEEHENIDAIGRARKRYKEGRFGGLGIILMSKCIDKMEYNDEGNVLTLTKCVKQQ